MPYVPSKKTDGKSEDRIKIDRVVEKTSEKLAVNIEKNSDLIEQYVKCFVNLGRELNKVFHVQTDLSETIENVAEKYNYEGAFLGELNYAVTRIIQRVPQLLAEKGKCGLVKGKELRYWLYAMTVTALTKTAYILSNDDTIGVSGVFEDIKDEYKVRVNKSYEIAQILKSGDCYDTPYFNKVVEIVDENNKVVGHTYIELINDGENVKFDKMPYKLVVKN